MARPVCRLHDCRPCFPGGGPSSAIVTYFNVIFSNCKHTWKKIKTPRRIAFAAADFLNHTPGMWAPWPRFTTDKRVNFSNQCF